MGENAFIDIIWNPKKVKYWITTWYRVIFGDGVDIL